VSGVGRVLAGSHELEQGLGVLAPLVLLIFIILPETHGTTWLHKGVKMVRYLPEPLMYCYCPVL